MFFIDSLRKLLTGLSASEPMKEQTSPSVMDKEYLYSYDSTVQYSRLQNLELYEVMDSESPECHAALNFLADLCTQGDDVLQRGHKVIVDLKDDNKKEDAVNMTAFIDRRFIEKANKRISSAKKKFTPEEIDDIIRAFEKRTKIKYKIRNMFRRALKNGDEFNQVMWGKTPDGQSKICGFYHYNPKQFFLNKDDYGRLNAEKPYIVKSVDETSAVEISKAESFRIQCGINSEEDYGTSLFWSARKTYNRLDSMESGMTLARVVRSSIRYLFKVDVTGMLPDKALEYLEKLKNKFTKKAIRDENGNIRNIKTPMAIDEDLFFPVKAKSNDGVSVLENDPYLSNIDDVRHFVNKLLIGLCYPKAATGDASGSRNALAEQDTYPIRAVKSLQNMLRASLIDLYGLELRAHGVDESIIEELSIEMPEIDAVSTVRKFNNEKTRADIIKVHKEAGVVSDKWLLENILYMTETEIAKVEADKQAQLDNEIAMSKKKIDSGIMPDPKAPKPGALGATGSGEVKNKTKTNSNRNTPKKSGKAGNAPVHTSMAAEGQENEDDYLDSSEDNE